MTSLQEIHGGHKREDSGMQVFLVPFVGTKALDNFSSISVEKLFITACLPIRGTHPSCCRMCAPDFNLFVDFDLDSYGNLGQQSQDEKSCRIDSE